MKSSQRSVSDQVRQTAIMLAICAAGIVIGQILNRFDAPQESIVCIYLLSVVLTAAQTTGYVYGIVCALIASLAYNFFENTPTLSLASLDSYFLITTGLMMVIAVTISSITSKVKEGQILAKRHEDETLVLYHLTKGLAGVTTVNEAINITLINISETFKTDCRILQFDEDENPAHTFILLENSQIHQSVPTDKTRDFSEYKVRPEKGYYINDVQYEWPMYTQNGKVLCSLAIPKATAEKLTVSERRMLNTMAETAGVVLEKLILAKRELSNQHQVSQERYKANLLRSISHDLRTPLAGISGTAEVLMEQLEPDSEAYRMATNIRKETVWLYNLVQNVLSLTRLQNQEFAIKAEVNVLEDVVDSAVETMKIRLPERTFNVFYPEEDVLAVNLDPSLIKQVVINLIDNANKYSPVDQPIEVVVRPAEKQGYAEVLVRDFGDGLSQAALEKIFQMFYTTKSKTPGVVRGYGLGLPICDSIMKAHKGRIYARNREDGKKGAVFVLEFPLYDMEQLESQQQDRMA